MELPYTPLFINGEQRLASTAARYEVRNPYSHAIVGYAAAASAQDCHDAVESAARAFIEWERSPWTVRRDVFLKAANLLATESFKTKVKDALKDEIAASDATVALNFGASIKNLHVAAAAVNDLKGQAYQSLIPGGQVMTQKRAMGVVYAIASWNVPLNLTIRAISIPIVCGNTVVFKLSEVSPRSQALVVNLLREAGLPDGVLNVVSLSREDAPTRSAEIIAHPAVRKVNFTGSDRVAKVIAAEAGKCLKPCVFELGGKAPVVVLNDANVVRAARAITSAALLNSGQICMSTERIIVQRGVAHALIPALVDHFKNLRAGGPEEPLSALFSEASAENVMEMLREAKEAGVSILVGDMKRRGAVVQPHLVADVKPGMRVWEQESFGPIAAAVEVDTVDEAVAMANASQYSLMAGLWTENVHQAFDIAARIRAGTVNVNGHTTHSDGDMGGLGGSSGYGYFNVDNFTDTRIITFHPSHPSPYPLVK